MTIEKITNEKELIIRVEGRLDTVTAPALEIELKENVAGVEKLILDDFLWSKKKNYFKTSKRVFYSRCNRSYSKNYRRS